MGVQKSLARQLLAGSMHATVAGLVLCIGVEEATGASNMTAGSDSSVALTGSNASATGPTPAKRFTATGEGVHDAKLGLTWAANDNGHPTSRPEAEAYCQSLGAGWLLPDIKDLDSIYSGKAPSYVATPLIQISGIFQWSSTPDGNPGYGRFKRFNDVGGSLSWNANAKAARALCIKYDDDKAAVISDAKRKLDARFVRQGDMVIDSQTGLRWTGEDNGTDINWVDARTYCANLSTAGVSWRLPSQSELAGLMDKSATVVTGCGGSTCKVSPVFALSGSGFWSGESDGDQARFVYLSGDGTSFLVRMTQNASRRALCVAQ